MSSDSFLIFFCLFYDASLNLCWIIFFWFFIILFKYCWNMLGLHTPFVHRDGSTSLDKMRLKGYYSKRADFMFNVLTTIKLKRKHCPNLGVPKITVLLFFVFENGCVILCICSGHCLVKVLFTVISWKKLSLFWVVVSIGSTWRLFAHWVTWLSREWEWTHPGGEVQKRLETLSSKWCVYVAIK